MKAGASGQKDLKLALEMLEKVGEIVGTAGLNPSHEGVQELAHGVAEARSALSRMLGAIPVELKDGAFALAALERQVAAGRSMDPMKIALRVLTALADKTAPDPADLDALIRIGGPKPEGAGWDEYACEALQKVLGDRAAARQSLTFGARHLR